VFKLHLKENEQILLIF